MSLTDLIPWRRTSTARVDPFVTMNAMQREMNRMFEDFWGNGGGRMMAMRPAEELNVFVPTIEVSEKNGSIHLTAELPGMTERDIDVALSPDNCQLTVRGEKKLEKKREDENFYHCERTYGSFMRTITLPAPVEPDRIEATYRNGVLEIQLQKSTEEATGIKHIKVKKA